MVRSLADRTFQLRFIGANLPEAKIREALDACLATDEELAEVAKKISNAAAVGVW